MSTNMQPIFPRTPLVGQVAISTANTARDGSGTMGLLVTAGADGAKIDRVQVHATAGTTTAGMIHLYYAPSGGGTVLIDELPVTAGTRSASVAAWSDDTARSDGEPYFMLAASDKLYAATHNAEAFNVVAIGGNY